MLPFRGRSTETDPSMMPLPGNVRFLWPTLLLPAVTNNWSHWLEMWVGYQSIALDGLRLLVLIRAGAKLGLRGRGKEIDLPCPECVCTIVAKGGFQVWWLSEWGDQIQHSQSSQRSLLLEEKVFKNIWEL